MSELMRRAGDITRKVASDTVSAGAAALMAAVGIAANNPDLVLASVPLGAFAGGVTEQAAALAQRIWTDETARVERFVATAEDESRLSVEELMAEAARDPRRAELLTRAVRAAARSLSDAKVDLLARVYVQGRRDDLIDEAMLIVDTVRELQEFHLNVLALLAQPGPGLAAPPVTVPTGAILTPSRPSEPVWRVSDILEAAPGIGRAAITVLTGKLQGLGLIVDVTSRYEREHYQPIWELTAFGRNCLAYLQERADVPDAGGI